MHDGKHMDHGPRYATFTIRYNFAISTNLAYYMLPCSIPVGPG